MTEITLALADKARNEHRDRCDLWHLTSNEGIDPGPLADGMHHKLEFRGTPCEGLDEAIRATEAGHAAGAGHRRMCRVRSGGSTRTVAYYGCNGEEYIESFPGVEAAVDLS